MDPPLVKFWTEPNGELYVEGKEVLLGNTYNGLSDSHYWDEGAAVETQIVGWLSPHGIRMLTFSKSPDKHHVLVPDHDRPIQMLSPEPLMNSKRFFCELCPQSFTRTADLRRHHNSLHDPNPLYCGCCDNDGKMNRSIRMDKFVEHQRKCHIPDGPINAYLCQVDSCLKEKFPFKHKVCFGTKESLDIHWHRAHTENERGAHTSDGSYKDLLSTSASSDLEQRGQPGSSPATSVSSDGIDQNTPANKRMKFAHSSINKNYGNDANITCYSFNQQADMEGVQITAFDREFSCHIPDSKFSATTSNTTQTVGACQYIQGTSLESFSAQRLLDEGNHVTPANPRLDVALLFVNFKELSIHGVRPNEYLTLSRLNVLNILETHLKSSIQDHGQDNPAISFSTSERTIKVRGSRDEALSAMGQLEMNLKAIRNEPFQIIKKIWKLQHITPPKHIQPITESTTGLENTVSSSKITFPLSKEEDSVLLHLWGRRILPALPSIMKESVSDTYSTTLVRQGFSSESSVPIIQIQTSKKPSRKVQWSIRRRLMEAAGPHIIPEIEFIGEALRPLAGNSEQDDADIDDSYVGFPHHKLFWERPGLSASIGMLCSKRDSATSCCYLDVDGRKLLLTVRHLIENARRNRDSGVSPQCENTLTSPALSEIARMVDCLEQYDREISTRIDEELIKLYGADLPSNIEYSGNLKTQVENKEVVLGWLEDHRQYKNDESKLALGSLWYETKTSDVRSIDEETISMWPKSECCGSQLKHHMDWSLWHVTSRAGVNQTRYGVDHSKQRFDFGDTEDGGTRKACQAIHSVKSNEKVYWIGQSSVYQVADVNPAPIQIMREGMVTLEWSLIIPGHNRTGYKKFRGDSGAGIMRVSDDSLIGMLCAYANDQLVITPIRAIIADIKEKCKAKIVQLWPILSEADQRPFPGNPSSPSTAMEAIPLSCDTTMEKQGPVRFRDDDFNLPISPKRSQRKQSSSAVLILTNNLGVSGNLFSQPGLTERPPSPIPSLSSSQSEPKSDLVISPGSSPRGIEMSRLPTLEDGPSSKRQFKVILDSLDALTDGMTDAMNNLSIDQFLADEVAYNPTISLMGLQRRSSTWPTWSNTISRNSVPELVSRTINPVG